MDKDLGEEAFKEVFKRDFGAYFKSIRPISTLHDFCLLIRRMSYYWTGEVWFRGQTNSSFGLNPSYFRQKGVSDAMEKYCRDTFVQTAKMYDEVKDKGLSVCEWSQVMQHHGFPTRLLDWTGSANTALFFAVREGNQEESACVWIMDPIWLNEKASGHRLIFVSEKEIQDEDDVNNIQRYFGSEESRPQLPLAVFPSNVVQRIVSQKGRFTLHGKNQALDAVDLYDSEPRIAKIEVDGACCEQLRHELSLAGTDEMSVFPDLDGLARHLKWKCIP